MSLNSIRTPLDAAYLDSKESYVFYHQLLDYVLEQSIAVVAKENICAGLERVFYKQYIDLIRYSVDSLRIKYLYDEEDNMKIDLSESGFPNYMEFRFLANDLELKKEYLDKLPDIDYVKNDFLNTLLKDKKPISEKQMALGTSIVYYTTTDSNYIYKQYVQGKIVDSDNSIAKYLVSWSFYDVSLNQPFICFMYFDFEGKKVSEYKDEMYQIIKTTSDRGVSMETLAYALDKKLDKVHPKLIKRIGLGPIHSIFSKDDLTLTDALLKSIGNKALDISSFILGIQSEEIHSKGDYEEGGFFSKKTYQYWDPRPKATYLVSPHRVTQMLYASCADTVSKLASSPITIPAIEIKK